MADTSYLTGDAETVKLWSRMLSREAIAETFLAKFMGSGTDSVITVKDETSKSAGDRITNILRMKLSGGGVSGDGTLEGNEESLVTYTDNLSIDQNRHAVRSGGRMSNQRVTFSVREEARLALTDWWADNIDAALFNQLAGNTAATGITTGNNTVSDIDATHLIIADSVASEASLTAGNTMSIDMIDTLVERAKTVEPLIRPIRVNGTGHYVMFLHPYQVTDLRTNTATGQWLDIQKAAANGGKVSDNPIFTGALGMYNNVVLHEANRVPLSPTTITSGDTVRRAVFCGAQAGVVAFGRENSQSQFTWVEETFDYGNKLGVASGSIWGAKRSDYNSLAFGTLVLATAAAQHEA